MSATENQLATRRALRAIFLLQGRTFEGARLKQLAEALECPASTALRSLEVLQDEGLVERIPGRDEFWRLSPRLVQLSRSLEQELMQQRNQIDEFEQRYSRAP